MEQTTTAAVVAKRPTFLTVLCILSFIGTALGLFGGIKNYMDFKALAAGDAGNHFQGVEGGAEMAEMANLGAAMLGIDYGKIATGYLICALLNLLILGGVLMMWKLKKTGFWLYTAGQVITLGVMFGLIGGLVGGLMGTITGFFAILFIILYAVNLKHMTK